MPPPVRFAMIGCGLVGPAHARSLREIPDARLVAIASRREAPGRNFAAEYGAEWTPDWRTLVARSDVDAVSVCTPPGTHLEIAEAAAAAGKHVFCEKPVETTLPRADALIAACKAARVRLAIVSQYRWKKSFRALKRLVDEGRLGKLLQGDAFVQWHRPQSYYDSADWKGGASAGGGGALINQSIHTLDVLRWIMGPVRSLWAQVDTANHRMGAEDQGVAALRFENGALGLVSGSTAFWPGAPERLEVRGTRGTVVIEGGKIARWEILDPKPGDESGDVDEAAGTGASDPMAFPITWHIRQIEDFIGAIREGREPAVDGLEGKNALELVLGIYRSARTGAPVAFPLRGDGFLPGAPVEP